jgi:hypothetical protein
VIVHRPTLDVPRELAQFTAKLLHAERRRHLLIVQVPRWWNPIPKAAVRGKPTYARVPTPVARSPITCNQLPGFTCGLHRRTG